MSDENCSKYTIYRNKLTSIIRLSRNLYYSNKIDMNKTSNHSIWQIVKDMIGSKNNTPKSFFKDGQEINNPVKIANMFNSYFNDIGPNLASKFNIDQNSYKQYLDEQFYKSLFLRPTSSHEIIKVVQSLKSTKSTGYDGICVNLLKKIFIILSLQ